MLDGRDLRNAIIGPWSLQLPAGRITALHGPSGCGKTSLLRVLADLDPHVGTLSLDGRPAVDWRPSDWRRLVCYLPASPAWWAETVGAHWPSGAGPDPTALQELSLPAAVADWPVQRLSSGEAQRLALLRGLAQEPRVLLVDEPTANLDAASAEQVEALIHDWLAESKDRAVAWVAHDAALRDRLGGPVLRIVDGRLETA